MLRVSNIFDIGCYGKHYVDLQPSAAPVAAIVCWWLARFLGGVEVAQQAALAAERCDA
jgi:hypothetical protein